MRNTILAAVCGSLLAVTGSTFADAPPVSLMRFDCGSGVNPVDVAMFSDTYAYSGKKIELTVSCYLIRHGDDYMLWDTGYPAGEAGGASGPRAARSLVEQLREVGVTPQQIRFVGVSHYHGDHTGQAGSFTGATLLIGKGDWDALTSTRPRQGANPAPLAHWVSGGGKVEPVSGDKDVFGDGTVIMLDTPGHTPGHHSLLVRLKDKGPVLLTGDLAHFHENYETNGVPRFNTNRADTLASFDRFKQIARNLNATVIVQHDARDIGKLPAPPEAAR